MKLVLFFIFGIGSANASEINAFKADWCSPNQIIAQDIKFVCVGSAEFGGAESTRALVIQRADKTRELFVETNFSTIDMMNLQFDIVGPVATNKPRPRFAPKYFGEVRLTVDASGEADAVKGALRFTEQFFAVKP